MMDSAPSLKYTVPAGAEPAPRNRLSRQIFVRKPAHLIAAARREQFVPSDLLLDQNINQSVNQRRSAACPTSRQVLRTVAGFRDVAPIKQSARPRINDKPEACRTSFATRV